MMNVREGSKSPKSPDFRVGHGGVLRRKSRDEESYYDNRRNMDRRELDRELDDFRLKRENGEDYRMRHNSRDHDFDRNDYHRGGGDYDRGYDRNSNYERNNSNYDRNHHYYDNNYERNNHYNRDMGYDRRMEHEKYIENRNNDYR